MKSLMSYRVVNGKICPVEALITYNSAGGTQKSDNGHTFDRVLKQQINKKDTFVVSGHAAERLQSRNINLNEEDMKTINEGINKAEEKGCVNSVILYKNAALVTSIKNRTVITVMDKDNSKDNIFTNVDSVVLL